MNTDGAIHVVVAVIVNKDGNILVSRRPRHVHQGGLWEFPGGKREPGESAQEALSRELQEELGISPDQTRPLIRVRHQYVDKLVSLDVYQVDAYTGIPYGKEGQDIAWVPVNKLREKRFPAANIPIIAAVELPSLYLITPEIKGTQAVFLRSLETVLRGGVRLVQLRSQELKENDYRALATDVLACCKENGAALLLNAESALVMELGADGVHLNSKRLMSADTRLLDAGYWVAASCHCQQELDHAVEIGVDFAVLSSVCPTQSHPKASPLGWHEFTRLSDTASVPVFGLGGLCSADLEEAYRAGAQGIAAISGLWPAEKC